jgi:hypothetical protein
MNAVRSLGAHSRGRVVVKALLMVIIIALLNPLFFIYNGIRPPSWRFQLALAPINLAFIICVLFGQQQLKRRRQTWDKATERWFKMIMYGLALFFFSLAAFIFFHR